MSETQPRTIGQKLLTTITVVLIVIIFLAIFFGPEIFDATVPIKYDVKTPSDVIVKVVRHGLPNFDIRVINNRPDDVMLEYRNKNDVLLDRKRVKSGTEYTYMVYTAETVRLLDADGKTEVGSVKVPTWLP